MWDYLDVFVSSANCHQNIRKTSSIRELGLMSQKTSLDLRSPELHWSIACAAIALVIPHPDICKGERSDQEDIYRRYINKLAIFSLKPWNGPYFLIGLCIR